LNIKELIEHIRTSAQLAAVLEASGWPKPGNVHRTASRLDARYEHFLAGSIALGSPIGEAAMKGAMAARDRLEISRIGVGRIVRKTVQAVSRSHSGGNTHLGICLLFVPLAAAAAKTYIEREIIEPKGLKRSIGEIMQLTTHIDAVEVYRAISLVSSLHVLGRIENSSLPDLYDNQAERKILKEKISLFRVMKEAASYDTIARELVTAMGISFDVGYANLIETFKSTNDINIATVHTFLRILSKVPDTLIARKVGLRKVSDVRKAVRIGLRETRWISGIAGKCLDMGGLTTKEGTDLIWEFDRKLQSLGRDYNPGTTADLTAAALMIALLSGLKI